MLKVITQTSNFSSNWIYIVQDKRPEWSGGVKVSCILHHRGVQLTLAYSWARPAILVAGKGRGGMFLFFCFFTFIPVPFSSLSLSFFSSNISSICFLPFSGKRHKMTHKGWGVVKPQHNQSRQKANNKNYVIIARLSDNGAILDLSCPSVIPSFCHSLPHSFLLYIILFILIR